MLTRFHSIRRPIINTRFRLKNVFRLTFRYYFIVILEYSVSLAHLGISFIVDQTRTAKSCSYLVCLFKFLLEGSAWHMYTR